MIKYYEGVQEDQRDRETEREREKKEKKENVVESGLNLWAGRQHNARWSSVSKWRHPESDRHWSVRLSTAVCR